MFSPGADGGEDRSAPVRETGRGSGYEVEEPSMARSIAAPAARRVSPRRSREAPGVLRPLQAGARRIRAGFAFVWERRRLRLALLAVMIALPLFGGGWLLLRRSPLVSVEHVKISGVHGPDAHSVDAALSSAARGMSTLDVHQTALLAAVRSFPVVRDVRAYPSFPHGLRIVVIEQPPVASLAVAGSRTAVAADGVVLGPTLLSSSLPSVAAGVEPAVGRRVRGPDLLAVLSVLGAAPAPLAKLVERAYTGPKGLTVAMHGGLLVYFGDAVRPHAKWLSLERVLADSSSTGASYVDVRVPARPAAGFPAGVSPPGASEASASSESGSSESPVASLAAGLSAGTGKASSSPPEAAASTGSAGGESSETPAPSSETSSAPAGETGSGGEAEGAGGGGTTGG
jgi:cell division protein FtsQ